MSAKPKIVVLVGPTAAGKTSLAIHLAERFQAEVISADAVAVYRGFDIGSAKPTAPEVQQAPHHLIDVAEPEADFTAARFAELAHQAARGIMARGKKVIVAGGTGLYVRSMLGGLFQAPEVDPELRARLNAEAEADPEGIHRRLAGIDPQAAERLHPRDRVRVVRALEVYFQTGRTITALQEEHRFRDRPYNPLKLGIRIEPEVLYQRIDQRTSLMFDQGLVQEVEGLLAAGIPPTAKPMLSIGYKQVVSLLAGDMDRDQAREAIAHETRRLAKRQMTWFRAEKDLVWLDYDRPELYIEAAEKHWLLKERP